MTAHPSARTIRVVDMHTAGEPVRIIEAGYPDLEGATILEKRRDALENHDALRRAVMLEPRGHAGMYGVIPTQASRPEADFAVLFTHQEGYSTMCGHATVALGRWAVDTGRAVVSNGVAAFRMEAPCGVVDVEVRETEAGPEITFESVDSFVSHFDVSIDVPGWGAVQLDVAFGGAFYAILPASRLGLSLMDTPVATLVEAGVAITDAVRAALPITHPEEPDLGFLYGTILTDDVVLGQADGPVSYNLCIFAEGQIDRSPTGSGVTARLALAAARGVLGLGQTCRIAGVSGQAFSAELSHVRQTESGVVSRVRVTGTAYYSGRTEFILEADDPFAEGFELPRTFRDVAAL